jgi:hypothetical protein
MLSNPTSKRMNTSAEQEHNKEWCAKGCKNDKTKTKTKKEDGEKIGGERGKKGQDKMVWQPEY